jgi:hypothetical protein
VIKSRTDLQVCGGKKTCSFSPIPTRDGFVGNRERSKRGSRPEKEERKGKRKEEESEGDARARIYLVSVVELVVHESGDDAGLADRLIAQEDELVLGKGGDCGGSRLSHGEREVARSGTGEKKKTKKKKKKKRKRKKKKNEEEEEE